MRAQQGRLKRRGATLSTTALEDDSIIIQALDKTLKAFKEIVEVEKRAISIYF